VFEETIRLGQVPLDRAQMKDLAAARGSLSCGPAVPFPYCVLYWLENARSEFD
jgi:hypothetical protein